MLASEPLVSNIIPTYNRAHLIGETLDSVLAQTYTNWECIIVDDGSTDNTDAVVNAYVIKDPRFKYYHRPPEHLPGGNGARNFGFSMSKGDYLNWLDSDDLISENKLMGQIEKAKSSSNCDLVTCKWARLTNGAKLNLREVAPYYKDYYNPFDLINDFGSTRGLFPQHVYLIKKSVIEHSGLWKEDLLINQDGEFFCRVIINSKVILFFENGIAYYRRQQSGSNSTINSIIKAQHRINSWRLINENINIKFGVNYISYVRKGKKSCFNKIRRQYPILILKNLFFFKRDIYVFFLIKLKVTRK